MIELLPAVAQSDGYVCTCGFRTRSGASSDYHQELSHGARFEGVDYSLLVPLPVP